MPQIVENNQQKNSKEIAIILKLFYENQKNVPQSGTFFDKSYFDPFCEFAEHLNIKNKKFGAFVKMNTLKTKIDANGNHARIKYQIHYEKGIMIEEIELKRATPLNNYEIVCYKTQQ